MKNNNNWLLIYSTSPVQGFITSSRKTRDFFLGSYILSYITFRLLNFITFEVSNVEIIYPVLDTQGIFKAFKGEEVSIHDLLIANFPNKFVVYLNNKTEEEIKEIRDKIKNKFSEVINLLYEKSFEEVVSNLCDRFTKSESVKKIIDKNFERLCSFVDQSKIHFLNYFQAFLIIKKIKNPKNYTYEYNFTEYLLGLRKTFRRYDGKEDGYKTFVLNKNEKGEEKEKEKEYYPNGCTVCGERLHTILNFEPLAETTDIDENERLCGVCLTKRYSGYFFGTDLKEKNISLKERDKQVLDFLKEITQEIWNNPKDWIVPFTRFPSTHEVSLSREKYLFLDFLIDNFEEFEEHISSLEVQKLIQAFPAAFTYALNPIYINKLWDKIVNTRNDDLKKLIFLHVEFLSTNFLQNLDKQLSENAYKETYKNYGNNSRNTLKKFESNLKELFKKIKNKTNIDFEKLFNTPPYFAIIFSDGDNTGKILGGDPNYIKGEFNKEFHYKFSSQLSSYANEIAKSLEEGFSKVVFAGGDDLYTFSHLSAITDVLKSSSELYRCNLSNLLKNPSTSAGVVIGHAKVNLKFLTRKVHEAEHLAKRRFGRNAFVIKVISRSGEESYFGSKFSYLEIPCQHQPLEVLNKLIELYGGYTSENPSWEELKQEKASLLSSRLPYTLREYANQFPTREEMNIPPKKKEETEEQYKRRVLSELLKQEGFILALLKREIQRKTQSNNREQIAEKVFYMLADLLRAQVREHLISPAEALSNIASLLYIARFIASGGNM